MRMPVYFAAAHQKGRASVAAGAVLVNFYAEQAPMGAKAELVLHGTPGTAEFADMDATAVRGAYLWNGTVYAVTNAGLYAVASDGSATLVGAITVTGPVDFADNGTIMVFVDGSKGWTYDGTTLSEITDAAFYPADKVEFLDGFFIFNRQGTGQFFISALYGIGLDPLDFATAEAAPDDTISLLVDHRELWLFGTETVEVWWNIGAVDFPFQRISGALIEHGCASPWCPAKANNTVLWLSNEGIVYAAAGYQPGRISTHEVENSLPKSQLGTAIAFTYVEEGHWFYQLTVGSLTWAYDMTTGLWHRRSHIDHGRHHASCYVRAFNRHLIGDYSTGKLHTWSLDIYDDDGRPLVSEAVGAPIHSNRARLTFRSFEVDIEAGVGTASGDGADPLIVLDWSDDRGATFKNERHASMGKIGERLVRARWTRLGQSRDRRFRIRISDPVKRAVIARAYAEVS